MRVFDRGESRFQWNGKYRREDEGSYREVDCSIPPVGEKLIVQEGWVEAIRTLHSVNKIKGNRTVCYWYDTKGNVGCCTADWWNFWKSKQ